MWARFLYIQHVMLEPEYGKGRDVLERKVTSE